MERDIKMDTLARYYTQEKISTLLVNKLSGNEPQKILELGIGDGSLSMAAFKRWKKASYYGVDIDDDSVYMIKKNLPFVNINHLDTLNSDISLKLNIHDSSVDIALCNPPYLKYEVSSQDETLFKDVKLPSCIGNKNITTDIIFLAKNLKFLKTGCELGIILPDSVLTNLCFKDLRRDLLQNHNIKTVIQLPDRVFKRTEARTHILVMEKNKSQNQMVEICKADINGNIIDTLSIENQKLIERMDYDFHLWTASLNRLETNYISLDDIIISLNRGNRTKKQLVEMNIEYFHTTNFESQSSFFIGKNYSEFPEGLTIAGPGDILIARVGKRCIGKVALVKEGYIPISDCVYRLRVKDSFINDTFFSFTSSYGQNWMDAYAHGVCARSINKVDLIKYKFPYVKL